MGDRRLAGSVHLQSEVLDQGAGILGGIAHRRHPRTVLRRGRLQQCPENRNLDVVRNQALQDLAGVGLGVLYFGSLWWNAQLLAAGRRTAAPIALVIGRFVLLVVSLALTSLEGVLPLLVMVFGLLTGRSAVMRRARDAAP